MYFKFKDNDIYRQTIIAYPAFKFTYVKSNEDSQFKIYLNDVQSGSGKALALDAQMKTEINVNTTGSELIYPFIDKTSGQYWTSNVNSSSFNLIPFGASITGTYMVKPTLYLDFISSTTNSIYKSLVNIWESQKTLSSEFEYENFPSGAAIHIFPREYYGTGFRKGSVKATVVSLYTDTGKGDYFPDYLNTFIAQDIYKDGILRVVEDSFPDKTVSDCNIGRIVGYVLYDYGLILFKSASMIYYTPYSDSTASLKTKGFSGNFEWSSGSYGTSEEREYYNWRWFGDSRFCDEAINRTVASIEFQGINKIQNLTLMCHSPKGKLNNSTNPTFVEFSQSTRLTQSSDYSMVENSRIRIKNIVSSSYNVEENFDKRTILSTILVMDENKKVLGIAKVANPIVKKESSDNTFKISLDL